MHCNLICIPEKNGAFVWLIWAIVADLVNNISMHISIHAELLKHLCKLAMLTKSKQQVQSTNYEYITDYIYNKPEEEKYKTIKVI